MRVIAILVMPCLLYLLEIYAPIPSRTAFYKTILNHLNLFLVLKWWQVSDSSKILINCVIKYEFVDRFDCSKNLIRTSVQVFSVNMNFFMNL